MPFKCELKLGESLKSDEKIEFIAWVKKAWDSESEWGCLASYDTPYLAAKKNGELGKIFTTFPCVLMKQGKLAPSDDISGETVLAIAAAEGDEIAYGKPHSIFKKDT